ncbi:MAG TPA: hypothetical protein VF395_07730, partial [Polyangiaceae bacterium]
MATLPVEPVSAEEHEKMVKQRFAVLGAAVGMTVSSLAFAGEHAVKRADVPDAVIKAVAGRYPQGEMKRFIREVEHGKTAYEVLLDLGGSRTELIVAPDGRIQVEEQVITLRGPAGRHPEGPRGVPLRQGQGAAGRAGHEGEQGGRTNLRD